jgi:hypothetical protein
MNIEITENGTDLHLSKRILVDNRDAIQGKNFERLMYPLP